MIKNAIILILLLQNAVAVPLVYTYTSYMSSKGYLWEIQTAEMQACLDTENLKNCVKHGNTGLVNSLPYVFTKQITGGSEDGYGQLKGQDPEVVEKSIHGEGLKKPEVEKKKEETTMDKIKSWVWDNLIIALLGGLIL